jgi:hypothetical protein
MQLLSSGEPGLKARGPPDFLAAMLVGGCDALFCISVHPRRHIGKAPPGTIAPVGSDALPRLSLCHDNFGYAAVGSDRRRVPSCGSERRSDDRWQAQMVSRTAADKAGDAQIFTYCRVSVSGYQ